LIALTIYKFKKQEQLKCNVAVIVNSSKIAEKLEEFCDEIINMSGVLNEYMLKNIKD